MFAFVPYRFSAQQILDRDGDGQSDTAELRAGTDPNSASSVFRITGLPLKLTGPGWRVTWSSVAGKSYKLQRSEEDERTVASRLWVDVATVTATGFSSTADDATPGSAKTQFYRVMLIENLAVDTTLPTIANLRANPESAQAEGFVTLTATAQDDVSVSSVVFYEGLNSLGNGVRTEDDSWRLLWPVTFDQNGLRVLTARATDSSGNASTSSSLPFTIAIATRQLSQTIGQILVNADSFKTEGNVVTPTGNIRTGLFN